MSKTFKVKTVVEVSMDDVASLLCSAFEGGSDYWCTVYNLNAPKTRDLYTWEDAAKVYPHVQYPLSKGGAVILFENGEGDDVGVRHVLDLAKVKKGLATLAAVAPLAFADILNDRADETTGDVFLQVCLFGEVKYS